MNTENTSEEIQIIPLEGVEMQILRDKASIDIQVSTAHAFKRDIASCINDALAMATIDVDTAMTCGYSVPRGGKAITGPSVHLAKIIMQNWGNFRGEAKVISTTEKYVESEAIAWDLQKNVAVKVTVKRSIMTNSGKMKDDMIIVTGNAANSIALRNAIFSVIPKAVTDKIYKASQQKIIGDASEFSKKVKSVFTAFKKNYDEDQEAVLKIVGKTQISQLTNDDLVTLIGVGQALKDGDTTSEIVFKKAEKTVYQKKADLKAKQESAKEPEKQEETKQEVKVPSAEIVADPQPGLFNANQMP
jgi:hypothetical protein